MNRKKQVRIIVGVLAVALVAFLAVALIFKDSLFGEGMSGAAIKFETAAVDGSPNEWDIFSEFYANQLKNHSGTVLGKLYLRYDCDTSTMYALTMATRSTKPVINEAAATWVSVDSAENKVPFSQHAWVQAKYDGDPMHSKGWEAAFPFPEGTHQLFVESQILDSGVQLLGPVAEGVPVTISCP